MCIRPILLKHGNRLDKVPCGSCPECLKKRQSGYVCRCIEEAKKLGRVWFITLTYRSDSVPTVAVYNRVYNTLRREDVKKWKREVRRSYLKKNGVPFPKFSFLICGEYGSRTHRPHYHGFLCGLDLKHAQILQKYWEDNYGFTDFKSINLLPGQHDDISCVARYVAKYCVKPEGLKNPYKDIVEQPRIMTSPGFGLPDDFERFSNYMRDGLSLLPDKITLGQVNKINDRCKYTYNGCDYALPLYLKKKIFYEKNLKGNLSASPLSKLCSLTLRNDVIADLFRELRRLETSVSEREVLEMVHRVLSAEAVYSDSREYSCIKDLLMAYQKDNF